jgi:hypothetical protein
LATIISVRSTLEKREGSGAGSVTVTNGSGCGSGTLLIIYQKFEEISEKRSIFYDFLSFLMIY